MTLYIQELIRHRNDWFVETGTEKGHGIITALAVGFDKIVSIEASEALCNEARKIFESYENVKIYKGDSSEILFDCIKDIDGRITFWLDAHSSYGCGMSGVNLLPVLEEIRQISAHSRKDHTILIDDLVFLYDNGITPNVLKQEILKISPRYRFQIVDGHKDEGVVVENILLASVGPVSEYHSAEEESNLWSQFVELRGRLTQARK